MWDFAGISEDLGQDLRSDERGRLCERRDSWVIIMASGGRGYWVEEKFVVFTKAQQ